MTERNVAEAKQRADDARARFFELEAIERGMKPSWRHPGEMSAAYERVWGERQAAYAEWMRANEELNEAEHPDGPDLTTWTVDAIRDGSVAVSAAFSADIERLRRGDPSARESTVRYLEADVWQSGSGYAKERIVRCLARSDTTGYEDRLRRVVITAVQDRHDRRELNAYALLARRLMNVELLEKLQEIAASSGKAADHATYVLRLASTDGGASGSPDTRSSRGT
jgi:hypothetical protein